MCMRRWIPETQGGCGRQSCELPQDFLSCREPPHLLAQYSSFIPRNVDRHDASSHANTLGQATGTQNLESVCVTKACTQPDLSLCSVQLPPCPVKRDQLRLLFHVKLRVCNLDSPTRALSFTLFQELGNVVHVISCQVISYNASTMYYHEWVCLNS